MSSFVKISQGLPCGRKHSHKGPWGWLFCVHFGDGQFIATLFIYLFIFGCVGSSVRARAFSGYGKWGPLFIAVRGPLFIVVRGPLTIAAPPAAGHRLQTRRLSSCGSRAQPLRGMWDPPRPGPEPVSPALAGRLSTTAPPGKPLCLHSFSEVLDHLHYRYSEFFFCKVAYLHFI